MKKTMLFIVFFTLTIWTASAAPLSLKGLDGSIYFKEAYLIDSSNMPGLFYDDAGSTTKFEVLSITPSRTIFSNKYVKYSDNFEINRWSSDSYSSYGIERSKEIIHTKYVLYPTVVDEQASVKYNIDFINAIEKATITVTGTRRDTEHYLSVWVGDNDTAYTRIIEFENTVKTTKQTDITSYPKDNKTWIEFRFLKSSLGDNFPRVLDFSIEAIYEDGITSPVVSASVEDTSYMDDFDTDKWTTDKQSSYGVSRSVNDVVANETVLHPTIADEETYVRYSFNLSGNDSALLTITGTRQDTEHNLTIWASQDNLSYTKITDFENTARTTKQADISNFIKNSQTWLEFRFFRNSSGDNVPCILDFSTITHQWRPLNITTGGDIEVPTRTIDRDHFYYFAPHYPSSAGVISARVAYLGSKYPVIDINNQRAVLGWHVKNDADFELTYGTPLSLGSGFMLEIEDMGQEDQAVVALKKDGKLLDRGIFEVGNTYSFKTEVAGVKDTELFKADVISVFRNKFNNVVELKHVYLLNTEATVIEDGESFGDFEVDLDDFDADGDTDIIIRLKKDKTFTLDRNSTIELFGGLSIKVADSDELRFAVIKKFTKSGTYQQTGPYGSYGQAYSINSFDAPGLFAYDMDKNDTLESLSISSSKQKINEIVYSSLNKNNRMAYLGKTYHASFSEEKMLLNEILKYDDDGKIILRYGTPIRLENFILELKDIREETVLLQLREGETVLEESIVESGSSFVYKRSIEKKDIEIFNATVKNVFRSKFSTFVEIENVRILNESAIVLKDGDTFKDDYEIRITDINGDSVADVEVKLKSGESFSVAKDSTTEILGGYMSLKAYDNTFLPVRSVSVTVVEKTEDENIIVPDAIATPEEKSVQTQITIQEQVSSQETSATEIQGTASTTADEAKNTEGEPIIPKNPVILGSILAITLSTAAYGLFKKMW